VWGVWESSGSLNLDPKIRGELKMDYKTKLAVLGALRYRFENENCKVNLPKETYAKALENF